MGRHIAASGTKLLIRPHRQLVDSYLQRFLTGLNRYLFQTCPREIPPHLADVCVGRPSTSKRSEKPVPTVANIQSRRGKPPCHLAGSSGLWALKLRQTLILCPLLPLSPKTVTEIPGLHRNNVGFASITVLDSVLISARVSGSIPDFGR